MKIETVTVGTLDTNCYVLQAEGSDAVIVIDPGAEAERILSVIGKRRIAGVLLTHGHFDHTGALNAFAGVPVLIHAADAPMLSDPRLSAGEMNGDIASRPAASAFVSDGQLLELGGLRIGVLHTPGHTPGSVCYRIDDSLFTGDTLFHRGYGRTDLPGGSFSDLVQSLRRLLRIPEDLPFYPGHGGSATLEKERHA